MFVLHSIGTKINSNYNTPAEIFECWEPMSFDGVYKSVFLNKGLLIGKDITLFITGDYIGKDNSFDIGMPREEFCTWKELDEIVDIVKCKVGWHSWSHADLTKVSDEQLEHEVTPPFPMDYFAYPYGKFDERVIKAVKSAGYLCAYGVSDGTDEYDPFRFPRKYL